ncbi:MAG: biotin/lipoyl-containing protein [Gemmatimonadaceae bacterium]
MTRVVIFMPQMGESIAEGTLSKWLKKVGDEVKRDEPIFEISTDKVDAEIPAPAAGVLAEILVKEGETVAVQTVVARLETEKGATVGGGKGEAGGADEHRSARPATPATAIPQAAAAAPSTPSRQQPGVRETAASHSGNGNSFEDRVRTKSSPLVRKIAAEHGVNIASLQGSGVAGRVTKRDILGFIESGATMRTAPPASRLPLLSRPLRRSLYLLPPIIDLRHRF